MTSIKHIKEVLSRLWIVTDDGKVGAKFTLQNIVRFLNELNGDKHGKV